MTADEIATIRAALEAELRAAEARTAAAALRLAKAERDYLAALNAVEPLSDQLKRMGAR